MVDLPPALPFDGCRERIERARAHSQALGRIWNESLQEELYNPFVNVNDDGSGEIGVTPIGFMPDTCALLLGEFLYQLRSALDGAVYESAILKTSQDPPPNENRLEFPICDTAVDFKTSRRKIAPLSDECKAFIESVQPYNTPKIAPNLMIINFNRTLGILSDWARKDRHRKLHVVSSWASNASPKLWVPDGVTVQSLRITGDGFLNDRTIVATFQLAGFTPGMKVQANPDLMIDIAVDEIPQPCADNDTLGKRLESMIIVVGAVVETIERLS